MISNYGENKQSAPIPIVTPVYLLIIPKVGTSASRRRFTVIVPKILDNRNYPQKI